MTLHTHNTLVTFGAAAMIPKVHSLSLIKFFRGSFQPLLPHWAERNETSRLLSRIVHGELGSRGYGKAISYTTSHGPGSVRILLSPSLYEHFMELLCCLSGVPGPMIAELKSNPHRMTRRSRIMWIHEVAPERLAELFHHYHQALTTEISGKGSEWHNAWNEVPQQEKSRLVSAARLALLELESMTSDRAQSRQYFAQPGEAEWGC